MRRIHKYPLELKDKQIINVSAAYFCQLSVQVQNGVICLWAEEDIDSAKCDYLVRICGTGQDLSDKKDWEPHSATVQLDGHVWHVYVSRVYAWAD